MTWSKTFGRDRHQTGMRHPGAVVAVAGLALLVGAHLCERLLVQRLVALDGDEGGHAAHGVRAAPMAGLDAEQRIRAHEGRRHRHLRAVGQDEVGVVAALLDGAEDVVPAAAVQPGRVLAQFIEDLVHLEGGGQRLDQHRRLDRPRGMPSCVLRAARRHRSRGAPPDGSPSWADRSRVPCRARSAPCALWKK